jgi:hypothetical protein
MGPLRCDLLTQVLQQNLTSNLKYLDVSSNGIGSAAIDKLLEVAALVGLQGIAVDANFFEPSAYYLRRLVGIEHEAVSLRGMHWDGPSAEVMSRAIKNEKVKFWDLSAQVIHQHSDPDLSATMVELIIRDCNPNLEALFFSNHRLVHINLAGLTRVHLQAFGMGNSGLQDDSLDSMIPLFQTLVFLGLPSNRLNFKNHAFIRALAESRTLKYVYFSNNEMQDATGKTLFEELCEHRSCIKVLQLRNCSLKKGSAAALLRYLGSGTADFEELDIGGNEMFHGAVRDLETPLKSKVECLYVGANGARKDGMEQLLSVISDLNYLDIDQTPGSVILAVGELLRGIQILSIGYSRMSCDDVIKIVRKTGAVEVFLVHSISQKTLDELIVRYREIPMCSCIHIGDDLQVSFPNPPIPLIVEGTI